MAKTAPPPYNGSKAIANGIDYQFVQLQAGDPNDYHLFPKLSLLYPAPAEQILQALGAIAARRDAVPNSPPAARPID